MHFPASTRIDPRADVRTRFGRETLLLWLAYGIAFAALHQLASLWATAQFYSLCYAPAGLRFAALWTFGPKRAPAMAAVEVLSLIASGALELAGPSDLFLLWNAATPALGYGLAIAFSNRIIQSRAFALSSDTLRFAVTALLAPLVAFAASHPWNVWHDDDFGSSLLDVVQHFLVFMLGDLVGILLIVPPLLLAVRLGTGGKVSLPGSWATWVVALSILMLSTVAVHAIEFAGLGVRLMPLLFGVAFIGLMFGRLPAWVAVFLITLVLLGFTANGVDEPTVLRLHLQLAGIAMMAHLSGSYADDQKRYRADLRLRDNALLHSERLKTLRAMSLAVIHELSQPLSTLSIETNYLARLSDDPKSNPEELREVSRLVARKAEHLSTMLRRLRSFGAASGEDNESLSVEQLVHDVVEVIAPDARAAGVRLEMRIEADLQVHGRTVELQQALINLLRNALAASPGGTVTLLASNAPDQMICLEVANLPTAGSPYPKGMGVGKLIVEAIAQMHGGSLTEERGEQGERRMRLMLPAPAAEQGKGAIFG